jgi:iron complex outermembrane receptor protein
MQEEPMSFRPFFLFFSRRARLTLLAMVSLKIAVSLFAQAPSAPSRSNPPAAKQQEVIQPVTTTVVVQGETQDNYLPTESSAGTLNSVPLATAPISATVVTRDLMNDQISRTLTDVVKNDASIGEDYAPVGYYGDFEIRGFPVDLATGLQINNLPIAGEQDVPLENKYSVELLKGIAGVASGVTSAGGLIDYITKRPAPVTTIDLATDHRGTSYAAVDYGRLFGEHQQLGLRTNIAGEDIHTYVESANGWRSVGAIASDWRPSSNAILKTDFEYQHKRERSVAGYQLLGGTIVPDIRRLSPSTMLADQPWSKPNIFDTFNAGSRLDLTAPKHWLIYMAANYSHSLIDDNVIYPYGAALTADDSNTICPDSPYYFFCPDGSYEAYDYRSPAELRIDTTGEIIASHHLKTGAVEHDLVLGGSLFDRSVYLSPSIIYQPIGIENIYQPNTVFAEQTWPAPGSSTLSDYNRQSAAVVQDSLTFPRHIRLTAGGRYASVADANYTGKKELWLPQYSATWTSTYNVTVYGTYSQMLSLGPQAPFWVENSSVYLAPFFTRQAEVGVKYAPGQRILISASVFRMHTPFFYPRILSEADSTCPNAGSGDLCFESDGRETHDGLELNAQGKAAQWLKLSASAAAIQALSSASHTQAFNDKQVINVPRYKTTLFADLELPRILGISMHDLHLQPGWSYTSKKEATRDDAVRVGGYNLFNLGARYAPGGDDSHISFHLYADNILNKRYWKDTGASYGDTFIHLGAPTTVRLSMSYRFGPSTR